METNRQFRHRIYPFKHRPYRNQMHIKSMQTARNHTFSENSNSHIEPSVSKPENQLDVKEEMQNNGRTSSDEDSNGFESDYVVVDEVGSAVCDSDENEESTKDTQIDELHIGDKISFESIDSSKVTNDDLIVGEEIPEKEMLSSLSNDISGSATSDEIKENSDVLLSVEEMKDPDISSTEVEEMKDPDISSAEVEEMQLAETTSGIDKVSSVTDIGHTTISNENSNLSSTSSSIEKSGDENQLNEPKTSVEIDDAKMETEKEWCGENQLNEPKTAVQIDDAKMETEKKSCDENQLNEPKTSVEIDDSKMETEKESKGYASSENEPVVSGVSDMGPNCDDSKIEDMKVDEAPPPVHVFKCSSSESLPDEDMQFLNSLKRTSSDESIKDKVFKDVNDKETEKSCRVLSDSSDDINGLLEGIDSDDQDMPQVGTVDQTEGSGDGVEIIEVGSSEGDKCPRTVNYSSGSDDIEGVLDDIGSDDLNFPNLEIENKQTENSDIKIASKEGEADMCITSNDSLRSENSDEIDCALDGIDSDDQVSPTVIKDQSEASDVEVEKITTIVDESSKIKATEDSLAKQSDEGSDDIDMALDGIELSDNDESETKLNVVNKQSDDIDDGHKVLEVDAKDTELKNSGDDLVCDLVTDGISESTKNDNLSDSEENNSSKTSGSGTSDDNVKQLTDEQPSLSVDANATEALDCDAIKDPDDEVSSLSTISSKMNSENSTDSERSNLKFNENVLDIIKSLSSPKHDSNSQDSAKSEAKCADNVTSPSGKSTPNTESVEFLRTGLFASSALSPVAVNMDSSASRTSTKDLKRPLESSDTVQSTDSPVNNNKLVNGQHSEGSSPKRLKRSSTSSESRIENKYVEIKNTDFSKFVRSKVIDYCYDKYGEKIRSMERTVAQLKETLHSHTQYTDHIRSVMKDLATQQSTAFRQYSYNPKVERRTVGVNVRILQHPENKPLSSPSTNSSLSTNSSPSKNSSPTSSAPSPVSNATIGPTKTNVVIPPLSTLMRQPILPSKVQIPLLMSPGNKVVGMAQSSVVSSSPAPITSSVMVVTNKPATITATPQQVVDLTDEDSPKRTNAVTLTTKGSPSNLVPLMPSLMQLVPSTSGTSGTVVRSQVPRLAYLVPQNSMPLVRPGGNVPRLAVARQDGPSSSQQPIQAFVLTQMPVIGGPVATTSRNNLVSTATPITTATTTTSVLDSNSQLTLTPCFMNKHPAPLPATPVYQESAKLKELPPRPTLKMNKVLNGIVLSWNMNLTTKHADIASYQLYAYQENNNPVSQHLWKKVGDVKALPLPMACTLTQFIEGHKYHFTVRAVDIYKRCGPFSEAASILLLGKGDTQSTS